MGLGNSKDQGNQGKNYPYQLRSLQLLAAIAAALNAAATPVQRTPSFLRTKLAGTVAAGTRSVSFYNSGTDDVLVDGNHLGQGEMISFEAGGEKDTLAAISYDAAHTANGELLIVKVV